MVQATNLRQRHHGPRRRWLHQPTGRRVLRQRQVGSGRAALLAAATAFLAVGGLLWFAAHSRVVPFVVLVDQLARPVASGVADERGAREEAAKALTYAVLSWRADSTVQVRGSSPEFEIVVLGKVALHVDSIGHGRMYELFYNVTGQQAGTVVWYYLFRVHNSTIGHGEQAGNDTSDAAGETTTGPRVSNSA